MVEKQTSVAPEMFHNVAKKHWKEKTPKWNQTFKVRAVFENSRRAQLTLEQQEKKSIITPQKFIKNDHVLLNGVTNLPLMQFMTECI